MTSRTEIANGALIKLGVQRIALLTEATEQARVLESVFGRLARSELRKQAWSFALSATSLGRIADPTGGIYDAAFNLPTDLLRIVQFNESWLVYNMGNFADGSSTPYSIEGRTLLTNDTTARIRYVRDLSADTALWDASFVEAFTCRLAVEVGPTLTKDKQKVRDAEVGYRTALMDAKRANAIELPPQEAPDSSWAVARLT